jgi:hypothetical protein
MAEAFAARTRELQLRIFATATEHGKASNAIRHVLRETPAFDRYRNLVYDFASLSKLAPKYAIGGHQFEQVGSHEGHRILRASDSGFQERAKTFLGTYQSIRSYLRYLANFARSEGWSGQLEDIAGFADDAWHRLAILAYGRDVGAPRNFIKMSDAGYAIGEQVDIESPWGAVQTKEAGVDAFIVADEKDNGEKQYYMVRMDTDGSPVGYSEA